MIKKVIKRGEKITIRVNEAIDNSTASFNFIVLLRLATTEYKTSLGKNKFKNVCINPDKVYSKFKKSMLSTLKEYLFSKYEIDLGEK